MGQILNPSKIFSQVWPRRISTDLREILSQPGKNSSLDPPVVGSNQWWNICLPLFSQQVIQIQLTRLNNLFNNSLVFRMVQTASFVYDEQCWDRKPLVTYKDDWIVVKVANYLLHCLLSHLLHCCLVMTCKELPVVALVRYSQL